MQPRVGARLHGDPSGVSSPFFPSPLLRHGLALASLLCTPSPSPLLLAAVFRWIHAAIPTIFDRLRPAQSVRGVGVRGGVCLRRHVGWGMGRRSLAATPGRGSVRMSRDGGVPPPRGSDSPAADLARRGHPSPARLRLTHGGARLEA
ncbi:hypothetical protein PVAP13_9NG460628 [Panicum virgatum]|uniref:Uncharacterized protein n=1 Tax=Panicum virgatum TaxID=38727 RepID=A0A8T0MS49_PANVG|nr:hypothetical protein PVAP13_9NG460628 [Panicum virgatum]